ncbi:MAG TPA: amino acid permease [Holophagaceae bacterium]|jgi:APA family basic amino acid/polyamine antiporter|nr:amino acid permease [Holophagaceae bacterium]
MAGLFAKKDLDRLIADANDPNAGEGGGQGGGTLQRHLGAFNLTTLGIGAIIGAGIFSLTGVAAAQYAGPGIVYSFVIGGILCALAGLCYAEMAAMVPVAGSAYAYSYATMGEFVAWIIGWDLVLEYAFGAVTVSVSWSGYLMSLLSKSLGINFSDTVWRLSKGPWEIAMLPDGRQLHGLWNVPASLVAVLVAFVLYKGIKESAFANNIIVIIKVTIVLIFILLGWSVVNHANWIGDATKTGLASLVPARAMADIDGVQTMSYGWSGVLTGAGVVFFAYIGFDAVSTTAQECRNPGKDMPKGILGSLIVCTVLYILMSLVMTGVVDYHKLNVSDPVAVGIDQIVTARHWSPFAAHTFGGIIKLGALAGLTSVILVMMLGQTRVFYAMSKDGLLPWFGTAHKKFGTPHVATVVTGIFVLICGGIMPMTLVGKLVSIGTLLAFTLVCLGIPILRITNPDTPRPFRTPFYWLVSIGGAAACLFVMWGLPKDTWIRLIIWLEAGLLIYGGYGWQKSRLGGAGREKPHFIILAIAVIALIPTLIWAVKVF